MVLPTDLVTSSKTMKNATRAVVGFSEPEVKAILWDVGMGLSYIHGIRM